MKQLKRLFSRRKSVREKSVHGDITPRGVKYTLVPKAFLQQCKSWDSDKFPNQIIV